MRYWLYSFILVFTFTACYSEEEENVQYIYPKGEMSFKIETDQQIPKQISINNIYPGGMKTELWKKINGIKKEKISQFLDTTDVSNLIEFVLNQKKTNIFKNITVFPHNDWH